MKALVLESYNHLIYKEVPVPEPGPDEILLKIKSCGICGSDVHGLDGSSGRRIPPIIMGHEASGIIDAKGDNVRKWSIGDRITFDSTIYPENDWFSKRGQYNLSEDRQVVGVSCDEYRRNGAFAEYVVIPQHILHRLPDNVSYNQAAMVEPASVALHAINLSNISSNDSVMVIGAGIIGLFLIKLLKIQGCKSIIAVDIDPGRVELAQKNGATSGFVAGDHIDLKSEVNELTANRGADVTLEAVGINHTVNLGIECTRKGGTVTLVGNITPQIEISLQNVVTRQLRLQGSCAIAGEYPAILDLISENKLIVDDLISATAPLSDGAEWFQRLYNKESGLFKVILNP